MAQSYLVYSVIPWPENDYSNCQVRFPYLPPNERGRIPFFQDEEGSDYVVKE